MQMVITFVVYIDIIDHFIHYNLNKYNKLIELKSSVYISIIVANIVQLFKQKCKNC